MNFIDALNACTQEQLTFTFDRFYNNNYNRPSQYPFWEYLIARQRKLTRDRLCAKYNITRDDFENYIAISDIDATRLLQDQLICTGKYITALGESSGFSDDDTDYINACSDQMTFLANALSCDSDPGDLLLACINYTRDMDENYDHIAFGYGYADFAGPISDLAKINNEDEGN